ncbi:MAG: hypothetical protein DWQ10_07190, partial [Calditrichaeota bacterium]
MKKIFNVIIVFSLLFTACSNNDRSKELEAEKNEILKQKNELVAQMEKMKEDLAFYKRADTNLNFLSSRMKGLKAKIVTNYGDIEVGFDPYKAPITCFAFIERAANGFYDNLKFHRIMANFMIQGGDPNSKDNDP